MALEARITDLLDRNKTFAETHKSVPSMATLRANNPKGPAIAILSCSDPRLIPEEFFKFSKFDATVTRNAGGRAIDAIRSLIVLDNLVPIGAVIVVHHTDCGGSHVTGDGLRAALKARAPSRAEEIDGLYFGEFQDFDQTLRDDIITIKASPYLAPDLLVLGFMYDLETGLLREVTVE